MGSGAGGGAVFFLAVTAMPLGAVVIWSNGGTEDGRRAHTQPNLSLGLDSPVVVPTCV